LLNQLSFVEQARDRLQRLAILSLDEFLADGDNFALAQHRLRLAAEAMAEMGRHLMARLAWGQPASYLDVFASLGRQGVLSADLAGRCEELARFRNILGPRYPLVTPPEAYRRAPRHVPDLEDFCAEITDYLPTQGIG